MSRAALLLFLLIQSLSFGQPSSSTIEIYRFIFEDTSSTINDEQKQRLDELVNFLEVNPKLVISISPFIGKDLDQGLSEQRFQTIQRYFINKGMHQLHFDYLPKDITDYPHSPETAIGVDSFYYDKNEVLFRVADTEVSPCDSVLQKNYLNFKKGTTELFETECANVKTIAHMVKYDGVPEWAVIAVSKSKDSVDLAFARERAEVIVDLFVKIGFERHQFVIFTNVHPEPKEDEPRDWPYYPLWFEYEMGVYFQPYI